MKFVVVTGGVISGLGKGITASSIALLLKSYGLSVTAIKIDPYLNLDAGTISPMEHGECYVLKDGGEADLDLGNYERFLNINLTKDHNITTGKIYNKVITQERHGKYLGKTVQVIPHITNEVREWIQKVSVVPVDEDRMPDVCVIELGGTVGDIESMPFIEALRRMNAKKYKSEDKICFVHVSLIVDNGEIKTKPTQRSLQLLRSYGIIPNMLIMRTPKILSQPILKKLDEFCEVGEEYIISNPNVPNIYYVPKIFDEQRICEKIADIINIKLTRNKNFEYSKITSIINHYESRLKEYIVAIAGKYTNNQDTYLSLMRAIEHASFHIGVKINIVMIDTEKLNMNLMNDVNGVIIPGGFGTRGIEGMIQVSKYCREKDIPLLGICLGMHVMICEYARYIGLEQACSTEWSVDGHDIQHPVIDMLPNQTEIKGGTMRLGDYTAILMEKSRVRTLYGKQVVVERHRHRYEVNNKYVDVLEKHSLRFTGKNVKNELMEIMELEDHKFYVACQFHPEYISRNRVPHPLFIGLIMSMIE